MDSWHESRHDSCLNHALTTKGDLIMSERKANFRLLTKYKSGSTGTNPVSGRCQTALPRSLTRWRGMTNQQEPPLLHVERENRRRLSEEQRNSFLRRSAGEEHERLGTSSSGLGGGPLSDASTAVAPLSGAYSDASVRLSPARIFYPISRCTRTVWEPRAPTCLSCHEPKASGACPESAKPLATPGAPRSQPLTQPH